MKKLTSFPEFLFKALLENNGDLPMYFSKKFKSILYQIKDSGNDIAKRLLNAEGENKKRVFIDIDENKMDSITFLISTKAKELFGDDRYSNLANDINNKEVYTVNQRSSMKINRFINDVFNNEYKTKTLTDEEKEFNKKNNVVTLAIQLEDFVNKYKTFRKPGELELVNGEQIRYWYNGDRYQGDNGTLNSSCMKHDNCQDYLDFYVDNEDKVSLLIMKSREDDKLIIGRALVWNLTEPSGKTYMDRIYTTYEHDTVGFIEYAKEKGWLYKLNQNMSASEKIVDTENNESNYMRLVVEDMVHENPYFPYLDTLKYYSVNKEILTNDYKLLGDYIELESTSGGPLATQYDDDELIEMYKDEILSDLEYYVCDIFSADDFWEFVDNSGFIDSYIDGEKDYYYEDFVHIFDDNDDDIVEYIKNNISEDNIPDDLDSLDIHELKDFLEDNNEFHDFIQKYVEDRYIDYTARDIEDEMYGNSNNINSDTLIRYEYYFDEDGYAQQMAENEDIDYLRERYNEN